jgi:hypothetical protein
MHDDPKKRAHHLKELTDEVLESINEDPEIEPGQADTTPAVPAKGTSNTSDEERSTLARKPKA